MTNNTSVKPLHYWVQHVLPLVYDDSLSYMELLARVVAKLNEVIELSAIFSIKYANPLEWDITSQYEVNTVVIDARTGVAYLSVQPVPAGIQIVREEYWTVIFDLELLFKNFKASITRDNGVSDNLIFNVKKGDLFWYKNIIRIALEDMSSGTVPTDDNSYVITLERWAKFILPVIEYKDADEELHFFKFNNPVEQALGADHVYNSETNTLEIKLKELEGALYG